ncbi:hypothetical protein Tco_1527643, partial [Tanacetum coccineum]
SDVCTSMWPRGFNTSKIVCYAAILICYVWSTWAFGMQLGFKSTIMGQYGIGSAEVAYGSVSKGNGSGSARNSSGFN